MSTVNRCICHKKPFSEIKEYAEKHECATVRELQQQDVCSNGCGFCIPYIEMMLESGETEFKPGAFYRNQSA